MLYQLMICYISNHIYYINSNKLIVIINRMLKVIFRVQRLYLKLNNIECQILARKQANLIPLCQKIMINSGQAVLGVQTEFYIIQNDPILTIQVSLILKDNKKLGGEVSLDLSQWEENILHSTISSLKNSPDKHSQLIYKFLYIKKQVSFMNQVLFLCKELNNHQVLEVQGVKKELSKKHHKLEEGIKKLKQQNEVLENDKKIKKMEINQKKKSHDKTVQVYMEKIQHNSESSTLLKQVNSSLIQKILQHGKSSTLHQLIQMYPQLNIHPEINQQPNKECCLGVSNQRMRHGDRSRDKRFRDRVNQ